MGTPNVSILTGEKDPRLSNAAEPKIWRWNEMLSNAHLAKIWAVSTLGVLSGDTESATTT